MLSHVLKRKKKKKRGEREMRGEKGSTNSTKTPFLSRISAQRERKKGEGR